MLLAALGLSKSLFEKVADAPLDLLWPGIGVALAAAGSTMLGHVAVLLLNKISGWRLLTSLVLSATALMLLHLVQASIVWALGSVVLGRPLPLLPLIVVGLISTAPRSLSVITALPHFGLLIGRVLDGWGFLILVLGVSSAFRVTLPWSLGFTLAGWFVMQLLSRLLQRPLSWVTSRAWTLATGQPTMITGRDVLAGTPFIPVGRQAVPR